MIVVVSAGFNLRGLKNREGISVLSFRRKRKVSKQTLQNIGGAIILAISITIGTVGHAYLGSITSDKPVEKWVVDEVTGKNQLEAQFEETAKEVESLRIENERLRTQAVSRGGEPEYLKDNVISAINNNLGGLLKNKGSVYYDAGKSKHVNPMLMAAISIHETANGTSKVLKDCNNIAGINWTGDKSIPNKGRYRVFNSIDDGIYNLAYILYNYYIRQNRVSIETIGTKFCPLSDKDDGKYGMDNKTWIPNVTKIYCKILEDIKNMS
jgi:hypothetical protein